MMVFNFQGSRREVSLSPLSVKKAEVCTELFFGIHQLLQFLQDSRFAILNRRRGKSCFFCILAHGHSIEIDSLDQFALGVRKLG